MPKFKSFQIHFKIKLIKFISKLSLHLTMHHPQQEQKQYLQNQQQSQQLTKINNKIKNIYTLLMEKKLYTDGLGQWQVKKGGGGDSKENNTQRGPRQSQKHTYILFF